MRNVDAAGLGIGDAHPPRVMGVLNVSPESPYDPSVYEDPEAAAAYVDRELIDEGADIVDVGLASANRRLEVLGPDEELERLPLAIEAIEATSGEAVFSIETRYASVAGAALEAGFDMVNDICGFADPEMPRVCADHEAAVVKMASPPDLEQPGALSSVDAIYEALERGGLTDRTIVDPAFGRWCEEQTLDDDRETFRRLGEFRALDRPILVSINRKNFLRKPLGRTTTAALPASLAATALAVERGANLFRTHDVAETVDAVRTAAAFRRERVRDPTVGVEEVPIETEGEARRHLERCGGPSTPERAVHRAYALSGLDEEAVTTLRGTAAAIPGAWAPETRPQLLFVTSDARHLLAKRCSADSERLADVFAVIDDPSGYEKTYTECP